MGIQDKHQGKRQFLTFQKIKWATIVVPVVLLAALDWVRHNLFFAPLHSLSGFIGTYLALGTGVAIFSYAIFGLVDRLQRQNNDRNRQLQALNDIAKVSAAYPGLDDVLRASLDTVLSTMKAEAGLICLVDLEKEEHSVVCYRNISPEFVRRVQHAKIEDDPIALEVVRTAKPVIIERVLEDPRVAEAAKQAGIKSAISAPLKSEGEVNGILAIATRTERHFVDADREFLEGIGGQLGMAIRNAVLFEQTRLQNQELNALLSVGKVATSSLDADELLGRSLDTIIEVTATDAAEIWLMENDEALVMRCHRGKHAEAFLEQTRFQVGDGIPGMVARDRQAIMVHDLASDTRFKRQKVVDAGFHTFYAMPLLYHDEVLGVLALAALSADCLSRQRQLSPLKGIGEWLALAIENTRLYRQVQDAAILSERERIAREMHDGMAQLLGYINTQTIAVKKFLSGERLTEAHEELTRMEEVTRGLYDDVREGILGLRTAARQSDGLIGALKEYVDRYTEMSGVQVDIRVCAGAEDTRLSPAAEIQLMRIIQEALTNVRKHSGTTEASVTFERLEQDLKVAIADDGRGFEPAHLPATGWPRFGLQTMRERAEATGGTLRVDSVPGKGTRVEIQLPARVRVETFEHQSSPGG
ncbi:MAG: GAF domain-containing sensor histidine kinase [Chloroflexi bacterium]|nr:GAF domain-containing sensor histidine kinase [Chloroflexota bacterium]